MNTHPCRNSVTVSKQEHLLDYVYIIDGTLEDRLENAGN